MIEFCVSLAKFIFNFLNYWCHSRTKLNFCIFSINFMQLKFCSVQKKLSRCTRKIENCVKLASIQNKWHLLFLNNSKNNSTMISNSLWIRFCSTSFLFVQLIFLSNRGKYYFTSMPFENIMVLLWISNFRQNWKKRNFLWAIRWRRRSFSWAAHNGFYHALIPLYCSQALLMWSDKGIKKPSICFTAHFELIPSVWLELGGATCA